MSQNTITPWIMWLYLTDYCNNKCVWCYEQCSQIKSSVGFIELKMAEKIVKTMKEAGVKKCVLIGGEPSLHPNLFDIIRLVNGYEMKSALVTNGRFFCSEDRVARLRDAKPDFVTISVHGWNSQKYAEFTHSKKGFLNVETAVKLFKKHRIKFDINITLSTLSANSMSEIVEMGKSWQIKHIGFNLAAPAVSMDEARTHFVPSLISIRNQVIEAFDKCRAAEIRCSFLLTIPHCVFTDEELAVLFKENSVNCGCQMLHGSGIIFQSDGSIALCNHLSDFRITTSEESENVLTTREKFISFWNSEELREIRKRSNRFRSEQCIDCSHWDICGGGCLVRWAHYNPNDFNFRRIDIRNRLENSTDKNFFA